MCVAALALRVLSVGFSEQVEGLEIFLEFVFYDIEMLSGGQ